MLTIYNTLSKQKEVFKPIDANNVKIYLCGPTVYDLLHIGNFRGVIFFNLLRNWIDHIGYSSTFVLNFTDVDDKIIDRAKKEGKSTTELTEHYINEYKQDLRQLNLNDHDINPKCTHHIEDMVTFITRLIEKDHAYHVEGSVFFNISSYSDYGKLSGKKLEDLNQGHRIDPDPRKRHPLDFVLWKPAKKDEPSWDSPWGKGRPGWHIECSAMNLAHHGTQIDIHGGGIDLIFPHHENEIAQTEALTKKTFSTYWVHNNFIRFGDEKMSKSLGNVIKARDYMNQYNPEILKFIILSVHYRSELNIDTKQSHQAISRLARIYYALKKAKELSSDKNQSPDDSFKSRLLYIRESIDASLNDDFNTPKVFASLFEAVRLFNTEIATKKLKDPLLKGNAFQFLLLFKTYGKLFSLFNETPSPFLKELDMILIKDRNIDIEYIESQLLLRKKARESKDFSLSDSIRDKLKKMTVLIQDTPQGTIWEIDKTQ